MSHLFGGESEKLGNNYEDNVLIYYYGQVMEGNYLAVMSESFSKDLEQGGDIYLYDYESRETVVQVKSRNGNDNDWSVSALIITGIIKNACHHISQGRKFILASPLSCIFLQDLIKHSYAFESFSDFFNAVKTKANIKDISALENEIKIYLIGKDPILFFHNFSFKRFDDDLDNFIIHFQNSVKAMDGGHKAFQLLRHYAIQNNKLSKKIYGEELWRYLFEKGVQKYEIDEPVAASRVIELCSEYKNNIKRRLIDNKVYPRKEFDALKEKIKNENVVVVHGKAGTGKSGIILQLCNYFDDNGVLYLPISLDAHMPETSTYQFGKQLLFTASPVEILSRLTGQRQSYLIIDQLDAMRWNISHSSSAFAVCCNLVKEVLHCENVKLIFVCRTIDADKILRFWENRPPKLSDCAIEIQSLSDSDVRKIVGDSTYNKLSPKVRTLLTNINNLSMFLTVSSKASIEKSSDIIREYINEKLDDIVKRGYQEEQIRNIIKYLVTNMRANNAQSVSIFDVENNYGSDILEKLISSGLLEKTNSKIKFAHQSILDYYFAQQLEKDIRNNKDIVKTIKKYNYTAINDYDVLKQFFEFAEVNNPNYVALIEKVLFSSKISSFIRHIALESFRTTSRTDYNTILLALKILSSEKYGRKYLYYIAYGNYAFAQSYIDSSSFSMLKQSQINEDSTAVVDFLLFAANHDEKYLTQLESYVTSINDRADVLTHLFYQIDDEKSSDILFNFKLDLLKILNFPNTLIHWDNILSLSPNRAGSYITIILTNEIENEYRVDWHEHMDSIENIVKPNPHLYHGIALKFLMTNCEKWELDGFDNFEYHYTKNLAKCVLLTSLKFEQSEIIIKFLQSPHALLNNLALKIISEDETDRATILLQWIIDNKYLLSLNFFHHRRQLALFKKIIECQVGKLNVVYLTSLINQIKAYKSPDLLEFAKDRFKERKEGYYYHFYEEEQRVLLSSIPFEMLNAETKNYISYLLRKFPQLEYYSRMSDDSICEVRNVVSGIGKKCLRFSYETWKQIIKNPKTGKNNSHHNEIDSDGNFVEYGRDDFERAISMAASIRQQLFVNLALNINDIPRDFIDAICSGLSEDSGSIKQRFPAVTDVDICDSALKLQVYQKCFDLTDKNFLMSFINFVENTSLMNEWIEQKLIEIAKNPQLYETAKMNVWSPEWDNNLESLSAYELETEKINRVQSCAIAALANTLFETKHINPSIQEILEDCYKADHPVLLFSAVDIIYPIWNFDKQFTMNYLIKILEKDMRVIRGRSVCMLLDRIVVQHSDLFYQILRNAINRSEEYLSDIGERIVYYYCFYNIYQDLVSIIVKAKPDMVVDCCLKVINDSSEVEIQDRAKKLLLSIDEKNLDANYYPRLTDVLLNNNNKNFSRRLIKKLKYLPQHEWHILLSDINELTDLANISNIIFMLSDIFISKNSLATYEADDFIGILVKLFTELYDKKDRNGWRVCLKKIDSIYDNYVINASRVMTKIK